MKNPAFGKRSPHRGRRCVNRTCDPSMPGNGPTLYQCHECLRYMCKFHANSGNVETFSATCHRCVAMLSLFTPVAQRDRYRMQCDADRAAAEDK